MNQKHEDMKIHGAKKDRFEEETKYFKLKWKNFLEEGDPYYSKNFSLEDAQFRIREEGKSKND